MALVTIEGIYRNGQIELSETPIGIADGTEVIITFLSKPAKTRDIGKMIEYGKYKDPAGGKMIQRGMFSGVETTEEDFKLAEFHGDPDDGLDWSGC